MKQPMKLLLGVAVVHCMIFKLVNAEQRVRVFGDRVRHPQHDSEFIRTYVDMPKDHDGDTVPIAIGMQFTPGFIRASDDLPVSWNFTVQLPEGVIVQVPGSDGVLLPQSTFPLEAYERVSIKLPQVGRNPFPWASLTFNFFGHPPIGVYDFQHFDLRFFMVEDDWWWGTQYNLSLSPTVSPCDTEDAVESMYRANLPIPLACWPGDPIFTQNVGHYAWGIGSHIYDLEEPGWQAWASGTSINTVDSVTWGMQSGQVAYVESMFSRDLALTPDVNTCQDFGSFVPEHFDTERWVPTRRCVVAGPSTIKVEFDKFVKVPAGCAEMRNSSDTTLVGWFPTDLLSSYGPGCKVPVPP